MSTDLIPWLPNGCGNVEYGFNMLLEVKVRPSNLLKSLLRPFIWRKIKVRNLRPIRDSIRIYSPF